MRSTTTSQQSPSCHKTRTPRAERCLRRHPSPPCHSGLVDGFSTSQPDVFAASGTSPAALVSQFVRGTTPRLSCCHHNRESSDFLARGALPDPGDLSEARRTDGHAQDLVARHKPQTDVLPYSVAAAGAVDNKGLIKTGVVNPPDLE